MTDSTGRKRNGREMEENERLHEGFKAILDVREVLSAGRGSLRSPTWTVSGSLNGPMSKNYSAL